MRWYIKVVWFASPHWLVMLICSYTCGPFVCPLWKKIWVLCTFLMELLLLCYWMIWVPYIFWILSPYHIYHLQILSSISYVTFLFWFFLLLGTNYLVLCSPTCLVLLLLPVLLCYLKKIIVKISVKELSLYDFLQEFYVSGLMFRSLIHFESFCIRCKIRVQYHSIASVYTVFPISFIKESIFSPLCVLDAFVKN